jgi:hypothetical protein
MLEISALFPQRLTRLFLQISTTTPFKGLQITNLPKTHSTIVYAFNSSDSHVQLDNKLALGWEEA